MLTRICEKNQYYDVYTYMCKIFKKCIKNANEQLTNKKKL